MYHLTVHQGVLGGSEGYQGDLKRSLAADYIVMLRMKNCDNHQLGSNPAQRSKEKTASEELIRNRETITSWALMMIIMMVVMRMMMILAMIIIIR